MTKHLILARIIAVLVLAGCAVAEAGEPPTTPILRIESGMHAAKINSIAVNAADRYLVTGSMDKTVRVWDLSTGKLLQTLRTPIGEGHEGKISGVAISPDGQTIAVGGWTSDWEQSASIYLFDRTSAQIVRRLTGAPGVIIRLVYSKDGARLVATTRNNGIRTYRTSDWAQIGEDRDYGAPSYGADFNRDGQLVTTSWDGYVRLYDRALHLIAKQKAPGGIQPYVARFSPDGTKIAVGFEDSTVVIEFRINNGYMESLGLWPWQVRCINAGLQ